MSMDKAHGATSKISLSLLLLAISTPPGAFGGSGNTTIHVFAADGSEGQHVVTPLVPFNGFLYGIAPEGGQYGHGTIFKITTDSNHTFTRVYSFSGGTDGRTPLALTDGGDGKLYFLMAGAQIGPTQYAPGLFGSMDATESLSFLHYFATNSSEGILSPVASLAPDGTGNFIGTSWAGGPSSNSNGVAFGITPAGDYTLRYDFHLSLAYGINPVNITPVNGYLIGSTFGGGANGVGIVYKMNPDGSGFTVGHSFTTVEGGQPGGGITSPSTVNAADAFFSTSMHDELKYGASYRTIEINSTVASPYSGVSLANDGNLYGALAGTTGDALFQVVPGTSSFTSFFQFPAGGGSGAHPYSAPTQAPDGNLYGATYDGGSGAGVIYLQVMPPSIQSMSPDSGPASGAATSLLTGTNFQSNGTVTVGSVSVPFVSVTSPTEAVIALPPGQPGTLNTVTFLNGDPIPGSLVNGYLYDFLDVPFGDPFHDFVEKIFRHGITAGIGGGLYGRDNAVLRQQMAVFLEKAIHGSDYVPPPCAGVFADVPCPSTFANWIEAMAADGITGGCGGGNFCPQNPVRRDQMSVFLLRAEHGAAYVPPACTGIFGDVPCPSPFADWIEQLSLENITGGCGGGNYCPMNPNTRGQMAVFIVKTFGL